MRKIRLTVTDEQGVILDMTEGEIADNIIGLFVHAADPDTDQLNPRLWVADLTVGLETRPGAAKMAITPKPRKGKQ